MSDTIAEPTSTQLLRVVFGGERDDPAAIECTNPTDWPREGD